MGGDSGFLTVTLHGVDDESAIYTARTEHTKSEVVINRFLTQEAMQDLDDLFPGAIAVDEEPPLDDEDTEDAAEEVEEVPEDPEVPVTNAPATTP